MISLVRNQTGLTTQGGFFVKRDLLKDVNDWVQMGFNITYDILSQVENGYKKDVESGIMPKFTYTFYINKYGTSDYIWSESVDNPEEGFSKALKWLIRNH